MKLWILPTWRWKLISWCILVSSWIYICSLQRWDPAVEWLCCCHPACVCVCAWCDSVWQCSSVIAHCGRKSGVFVFTQWWSALDYSLTTNSILVNGPVWNCSMKPCWWNTSVPTLALFTISQQFYSSNVIIFGLTHFSELDVISRLCLNGFSGDSSSTTKNSLLLRK